MSARKLGELLVALAAGALFSVGLALAGMTQPAKVVAFLDVAGSWDPSLALVMIGAIAIYAVAHRLAQRRSKPLLSARFELPTRRDIDPKLVLGAALFGVGWGLSGYCPGPALTSLATGALTPLLFVAAMATGMLLFELTQRLRAQPADSTEEAAPAVER